MLRLHIAVLGASGNTGRILVPALAAAGHTVTAVHRAPPERNARVGNLRSAVADLDRPETLPPALAGAEVVISLAYGRHLDVIRAHLPATCRRWVVVGSLRDPTWLLAEDADGLARGRALAAAAETGAPELICLDPAMIYGAPNDQTIGRLLRLIRRWPRLVPLVVPVPAGRQARLQPVFVDDMVAALVAAVERPDAPGPPIAIAGPEPLTYATLIRDCARSLGRRAIVVPIRQAWLHAGARVAAEIGLVAPTAVSEVARMGRNQAVDVSDMAARLGVTPRPFAEGVRLKVERGWY